MSERFLGLDLLRAILMFLGIPYHTGLIFSGNWIYVSQFDRVNWIFFPALIPHSFRMQIFFLIAGFFTALLIDRKSFNQFIESRLYKIIIPFMIFYFIFDIILIIISNNEPILNWQSAFFGHFWFIYSLMIFYFLVCIFRKKILELNFFKILLISFIFIFFGSFIPEGYLLNTLKFSPFFLLGCLFYNRIEKIKLYKNQYFILLFLFCFSSLLSFYFYIYQKDLDYYQYIENFLFITTSLPACFLIFFSFKSLKINSNKYLETLIKSSFTIYIIHMPLVVLWSVILDNYIFSPIYYFISIVIMTTLSSFFIYFLLKANKSTAKILALR